jgi:Kef-type K+ transport system membrane component KefB
MRRWVGLAAVCLLIVAVRLAMPAEASAATAAMALGFVLLVAFVLGRAVRRFGLPSITGYILVGMVSGPYLLGWLHPAFAVLGHSAVSNLRLLDGVALGLIALSAGGELKLDAVRHHARAIAFVIAAMLVLVCGGTALLVLGLHRWAPALADMPLPVAWVTAMLLGTIALTNSPAVTLALMREMRPRGAVSQIVLAIVVVNDLVVIVLFTLVLAVAGLLLRPEAGFSVAFLLDLGWEMAGSIALGVALGWLVAWYLERIDQERPLLVLGTAFVAVAVLPAMHLSGVLALMVAGFFIENHSPHGQGLMDAIDRHSLPVYVVFFTIAGAHLNLETLARIWPLAVGIAIVRGVLIALSTWWATRLAGAEPSVQRWAWTGLIPQAGVAIGLAVIVESRLPEAGTLLNALVVALIAVNQIVGPILARLGLIRAGEAQPEEERRSARAPARG